MRLWLEVAELSDFQEKLGDQILWDEISQFLGYLQFISELKKMKKKSENSDFTEKIASEANIFELSRQKLAKFPVGEI